jgi:hypothetical protein
MSDNTTGAPCVHCFCKVNTAGDLRCHRCGTTKPYEPPKEHTCQFCRGTGKMRQAYDYDIDFAEVRNEKG